METASVEDLAEIEQRLQPLPHPYPDTIYV